jgi:predicted HTH transcriptional regulator
MNAERNEAYLAGLLRELRKLPNETEWVEFKASYADPQEIGEYISALSNAAALCGKTNGYLVWGVDDGTHEVTGTTFRPELARKGNEELESWLLRLTSPRIHFRFHRIEPDGKPVVILEIPRATNKPVSFSGLEFIRVGSYKKKLKEFPEKERALWRIFDNNLLPSNEVIGQALRRDVPVYPELAVRELVANAIIHQDFFIRGSGPMIEIFSKNMSTGNS